MSIPAAPPIGLDTMAELNQLHVPKPGVPVLQRRRAFVGTVLLGLAAGHRSMTPLAVLARTQRCGVIAPIAIAMLAAAELVVDKLPFVPARTRALPAFVRALSGAVAGGAAARCARRSLGGGAFIGAAAAVAATPLGFHLRLAAEDALQPLLAALVEDALALSMAIAGASLVRAP